MLQIACNEKHYMTSPVTAPQDRKWSTRPTFKWDLHCQLPIRLSTFHILNHHSEGQLSLYLARDILELPKGSHYQVFVILQTLVASSHCLSDRLMVHSTLLFFSQQVISKSFSFQRSLFLLIFVVVSCDLTSCDLDALYFLREAKIQCLFQLYPSFCALFMLTVASLLKSTWLLQCHC